ncbi:MAG TPA: DUF488 domain-containing protein, partial [Geoalkalibacter subterraneus]|nr:DUF488 domain-containing protein [Geoalkalibacter subterraneus]
MAQIRLRRAYDPPGKDDGTRILVDRVWPRGVSKEDLQIDFWAKNIAPSTELRRWFGHDPDKWSEFRRRYFNELDHNGEAVEELLSKVEGKRLTLVYGARDEQHNNAVALKEYLSEK